MTRYTHATWGTSERAADMLFWADAGGVMPDILALAACACVRLALVHADVGDVAHRVVALTEAWARGEVEVTDVEAVTVPVNNRDGSARMAAFSAVNVVQELASNLAAEPHQATRDAAHAAACAVMACFPAAPPVLDAVRREAQRRMADLVRAHIPWTAVAAAYARGRHDRPSRRRR